MGFTICIVGCGYMAINEHGPALRKYAELHSDVVLAACCDTDIVKAKAFSYQFGFRSFYLDLDEMLKQEHPDAVVLMVPVHVTAALAVAILERAIPLIMEKPPGMNVFEANLILQAADKSNVPNRIAYNRRYTPLVTHLKKIILKNKCFGSEAAVQHISCDFYRMGRKDPDFSTTAIHGIDTVSFLADSPYAAIDFYYQELHEVGPGLVNIFMDCRFLSGATAQLSFCPMTGVTLERYTVHGLGESFFLDIPMPQSLQPAGKLVQVANNNLVRQWTHMDMPGGKESFEAFGFYHENAGFFDAVRKGILPEGGISEGIQAVEIAECIRNRELKYKLDGL